VGTNIENPNLGELDWSPTAWSLSLTKVYEHTMSVSTAAQKWYAASIRRSGRLAARCA
jgi:hypothetical protein